MKDEINNYKKIFLFLLIIPTIFLIAKDVYATSVTQEEALNWVRDKANRGVCYKLSEESSPQCVDLVANYFNYLGLERVRGNGGDYALPWVKEYVEQYGWKQIQNAQPQPGDIIIYTAVAGKQCTERDNWEGCGHVGIYEADNITYHQNTDQKSCTHKITWHYRTFHNPYWGVIRPNFANGDLQAPVITEAFVDPTTMTGTTYTVKVKATDNVGVTKVRVPTWTLQDNANGEPQDDLIWYDAVYNSNTGYWEYTVNASNHNNELGIYRTHIYAYDAKDNKTVAHLQFIPMKSTINTSYGDDFYARISVSGLDNTNSWVVGLVNPESPRTYLSLKNINNEDDSQIYRFLRNSDNTYSIINKHNGLYLDTEGNENKEARLFEVFSSNNQDNQKFYLMNYNGGIRIVPKMSDDLKGMDLKGAQLIADSKFELYNAKTPNKTNQTFGLLKVAGNILIDETNITLNVNATKNITATVTPDDTYNTILEYTSDDTSIATVENGSIKGIKAGNTIIRVKSTDGSNITKEINVTVGNVNTNINGLKYNSESKKWEYYSYGEFDSNYNGLASNSNGTYYVNNGVITFKHNELIYYKGKWTAIVNSKVQPKYTGLSTNKNGTYYLQNGVLSFKYNGTYKDSMGNVYVLKNSKVDTSFTGLKYVNGKWSYFKKGKTDYTYTGYATNNNGTYYVENGKITFKYNSLAMYNGKWTAIVNSKVQPKYTGLSTNKNGTYYLQNGVLSFKYNGTYKDGKGNIYVIKKSKVDTNFKGLKSVNGKWYYFKNGKTDYTYTGYATNTNGTYYVENGKITFKYNKLVKYNGKWTAIVNSKVRPTYTGLSTNNNGTFMLINGILNFKYNAYHIISDGNIYILKNSKVDTSFTGLKSVSGIWLYFKKGVSDYTYTGVVKNSSGIYLVQKGVVTFKYNGTYKDSKGNIYVIKKSKVDTSFKGLKSVSGKWYYFNKGKMDYTYTGLASNSNGTFYVQKGKITFKYNGIYKDSKGNIYVIKKSKIDTSFNGLKNVSGKWYCFKKGKTDYTYTGLASNSNGTFYVQKGIITFKYNGKYMYKGKTYTIMKSKVVM